jgi:transglutaminase-like putative cysteine protease
MARRDDPLSLLRDLTTRLYSAFEYASTTSADSPMDDALGTRSGVCQDFAHIMIALCRFYLRIPCRYVSGYLYTGQDDNDRSAEDASHAWVEAWLPEYGWIGFDPTNNLLVVDRHIRVAVGRDYADVPPTHGVFRGEATTELSVGVQVKIADDLPFDDDFFAELQQPAFATDAYQQQQEQQQQ